MISLSLPSGPLTALLAKSPVQQTPECRVQLEATPDSYPFPCSVTVVYGELLGLPFLSSQL